MKKLLFLSVVGLVSVPLLLFADDVTVCKKGTSERRIEVSTSLPDKKVPCEVKYFKEGDAEGKVVWNAQTDEAFCSQKAQEMADKFTTGGWECSGGAAGAAGAAGTSGATEASPTPAPAK